MTTPRPHTAPAAPRPPRDEYAHARSQALAQIQSIAEWIRAEWPDTLDPDEWPDLDKEPCITVDGETYYDEDDFDRRKAEELDPLSLEYRSAWTSLRDEMQPDEIRAVLCTGGPHVEIQCDIEGDRPRLLCNDWYLTKRAVPLTRDMQDALEAYAAYLAEGCAGMI